MPDEALFEAAKDSMWKMHEILKKCSSKTYGPMLFLMFNVVVPYSLYGP